MENTITIFDASTGELIEREATAQELAEQKAVGVKSEEILKEQQARIAARESALAKLAAIGLTEEEIRAL